MNKAFLVLLFLGVTIGCAHIKVDAPKEPIKLDVTMRLDIYQHIQSDIDDIENMVSGSGKKANVKGKQSFLSLLIPNVHAEDGLGPKVQEAVERRQGRYDQLMELEAQGAIGENKQGMVVVKSAVGDAHSIVSAENADRRVIYEAVAEKNGSSAMEVANLYAKRLQSDAPSGTPIETSGGWQIK